MSFVFDAGVAFVVKILLLSIGLSGAYSFTSLCPSTQMARRQASPSCWVSFKLEEDRRLCLSRNTWHSWLKEPFSLCGEWDGKWKGRRFPDNATFWKSEKNHLRWVFDGKHIQKRNPLGPSQKGWHLIERMREGVSETLRPVDQFGILRKLILNEETPQSQHGLWRRLGFIHVLSATGIHLYALARWIQIFFLGLCIFLPLSIASGRKIAHVTAFIVWASCWALAGFRLGMLRPLFIVGARTLAENLGITWRPWAPLLLALLIDGVAEIVLQFPAGHFSGRIIYALAVGGGLMAMEWVRTSRHSKSFWLNHVALSVGSWLPTAVWEGMIHSSFAVMTPLLSLLTIPFYTMVAYPLGLMGWTQGLRFHDPGIEFVCRMVLSLPNLYVIPTGVMLFAVLLSLAVILLIPLWRIRLRWIGVILIVGFLSQMNLKSAPVESGATRVEQLDVGQGDAALVFSERVGLIDVGSKHAFNAEAWVQILSERSVSKIHWIALTHLDEDHVGGLEILASLIPIRCVVTSLSELKTPRGKELIEWGRSRKIPIVSWKSGCFPYAFNDQISRSRKKQNGNMTALLIPLRGGGFYLNAGDADREDELHVMDWIKELEIRSGPRILKISHHGSRFSTSEEFLKSIRPSEAWISSGLGNRHGHPATQVLTLLKRLQIPTRRTDQEGVLIYNSLKQKVLIYN